ncbi:MAG: lipoprotein [Nibricoccus sp.]
MKRLLSFLSLTAALTGCASAPSATMSQITVVKERSPEAHVIEASIVETNGHVTISGKARRPFAWGPLAPTHIDIYLIDGEGRSLGLHSVPIQLKSTSNRRHAFAPSSSFQVSVEPSTHHVKKVIITPHAGASHS